MYQVFDSGVPADKDHQKVHESWAKSKFDTLDEARQYAIKWFHPYLGGSYGLEPKLLEIGEKYDFTGFGDFAEIREVD